MRTICAWCGKVLREGPTDRVSHGICRRCLAQQLASDLGVTPAQALADILRDECQALRARRCAIEDELLMAV
jgi:hypothetical protein